MWEDPALPGPARGVAAVQEFMRGSWVGFPDLRFDETDSPHRTAQGDQVAWRWRMRGTMSGPLDPPGFAPDRPLDGGRGRRPVDDARRAHRALPRLLRRQRPGAPARHRAASGEPRREGDGRASSASRRGCSAAGADGRADFDAVVVGASVAGCTAARLFAQRGARVALVEQRPDLDAYKTVCTHYIQPSATPTIERLGLAALIEEHGAVRNSIDLWTPYGGWIRHRGDAPYGYNVTRQVLDPLLRRMTAETPGVELLPGHTATELLGNGDGSRGVVVEDRHRARRALRGRLVVAADGRDTRVARMAGVKAACARTTASSTGPTGAASSPSTTARGCGSWSPTAPTPSPTRTASA